MIALVSRLALLTALCAALAMPEPASAQAGRDRPNIVLIFPDNLGWGEVGVYGSVRGVPTPNIDRIAAEGIRLHNFNTEAGCINSRMALLTGRYAARMDRPLPLEEVTIADALRGQGYATGLFGKWHLSGGNWEGDDPYRNGHDPQYQGFDEWYGILGTSHVAQFTTFDTWDSTSMEEPYVWEGGSGQPSRRVMPYNMETRGSVDREAAERGIAFMERSVSAGRPFFFYYPMTQTHFPTLPHPDFAGTTGAGDIGDAMADVDHNVGLVLEALERLGIAENTFVLWCTDDGAEGRRPWRGSAGPWRGFYAGRYSLEGGTRTPCVIRWPGRIPAGRVSNEVVHQVDLLPTFAAAVGAPDMVPDDRPIDGVNQLPFLEGGQDHSNRESVIQVRGTGDTERIVAVKWRDWKLWYDFPLEADVGDPPSVDRMRLFHLLSDPKEETDVKDFNPWVLGVMDSIVAEYQESTPRSPNVPVGTPDPYSSTRISGDVGREMSTQHGTASATLTPPAAGAVTAAQRRPDFSGYWVVEASGEGRGREGPGSGWGPSFTIVQRSDSVIVERQFFEPRDIQPPLEFRYALDGTESRNIMLMGRGRQEQISTARWEGDALVIVTRHMDRSADGGRGVTSEVRHTLSYQPASWLAHRPQLVIETTRSGVLGGISSTTRTVYLRGASW